MRATVNTVAKDSCESSTPLLLHVAMAKTQNSATVCILATEIEDAAF